MLVEFQQLPGGKQGWIHGLYLSHVIVHCSGRLTLNVNDDKICFVRTLTDQRTDQMIDIASLKGLPKRILKTIKTFTVLDI